jgi:hypothetical protein
MNRAVKRVYDTMKEKLRDLINAHECQTVCVTPEESTSKCGAGLMQPWHLGAVW